MATTRDDVSWIQLDAIEEHAREQTARGCSVALPPVMAQALVAEIKRLRVACGRHPAQCKRCGCTWDDCSCMGGPRG